MDAPQSDRTIAARGFSRPGHRVRDVPHRDAKATENPHVMVTRGTRARTCPASAAYVSHLLDPCGVPPRMLRSTRLLGLLNTMDPKLVAAVFGKDAESVMIYLADHVDPGRLPDQPATRPQEKS